MNTNPSLPFSVAGGATAGAPYPAPRPDTTHAKASVGGRVFTKAAASPATPAASSSATPAPIPAALAAASAGGAAAAAAYPAAATPPTRKRHLEASEAVAEENLLRKAKKKKLNESTSASALSQARPAASATASPAPSTPAASPAAAVAAAAAVALPAPSAAATAAIALRESSFQKLPPLHINIEWLRKCLIDSLSRGMPEADRRAIESLLYEKDLGQFKKNIFIQLVMSGEFIILRQLENLFRDAFRGILSSKKEFLGDLLSVAKTHSRLVGFDECCAFLLRHGVVPPESLQTTTRSVAGFFQLGCSKTVDAILKHPNFKQGYPLETLAFLLTRENIEERARKLVQIFKASDLPQDLVVREVHEIFQAFTNSSNNFAEHKKFLDLAIAKYQFLELLSIQDQDSDGSENSLIKPLIQQLFTNFDDFVKDQEFTTSFCSQKIPEWVSDGNVAAIDRFRNLIHTERRIRDKKSNIYKGIDPLNSLIFLRLFINKVLHSLASSREDATLGNVDYKKFFADLTKDHADICFKHSLLSFAEDLYAYIHSSWLTLDGENLDLLFDLANQFLVCTRLFTLKKGKDIEEMIKDIRKELSMLDNGKSVLLPGGYLTNQDGHATLYQLTRRDSFFTLDIINTGEGSLYLNDDKDSGLVQDIRYQNLTLERDITKEFLQRLLYFTLDNGFSDGRPDATNQARVHQEIHAMLIKEGSPVEQTVGRTHHVQNGGTCAAKCCSSYLHGFLEERSFLLKNGDRAVQASLLHHFKTFNTSRYLTLLENFDVEGVPIQKLRRFLKAQEDETDLELREEFQGLVKSFKIFGKRIHEKREFKLQQIHRLSCVKSRSLANRIVGARKREP